MKNIDTFGFCAVGTREFLENLEPTVNKRDIKPYEITFTERGMPIMAVALKDDKLGYISPFRGYRFQVSGTISGEWDLGASEVITSMYEFAFMGELGALAIESFAHVACLKAGVRDMLVNYTAYSAFICLSIQYLRDHAGNIKSCYGIA